MLIRLKLKLKAQGKHYYGYVIFHIFLKYRDL